eukprot:maker-scaffold_10-snap-gene-11.0-mRNA-1 protein AED:0.06 eAED:0.06 QI:104/0.5/0.33/1/1/1/3/0/347
MSFNQSCPCGLIGDDCLDLDPRLNSPSDALDELCSEEGFSNCFVSGTYGAVCVCNCGFKGDLCEEKKEPLGYNQILSFVVPILIFLAIGFGFKRWDPWNHSVFEKKGKNLTEGRGFITPVFLLVYRVLLPLSGIIILALEVAEDGAGEFRTFTNITWMGLILTYFIGAYLSFQKVTNQEAQNEDPLEHSNVEKAFFILFSSVLVLEVFIFVVVWGYLYPTLLTTGQEDDVANVRSYFFHGIYILFMGLDFFTTSIKVVPSHFLFVLTALALYTTFHTLVNQGEDMCSIYSFFDQDSPLFAGFIIGFMLAVFLFHMVLVWISNKKEEHRKKDFKSNEDKLLAKEVPSM